MYSISFEPEALLPRERLLQYGPEKLSNQELLSILIRTGTRHQSVYAMASQLLNNLESLTQLRELTIPELQTLAGIGQVRAIEIKAMIELGKRINQVSSLQTEQILSSEKLARKMMQELGDKKQEHLIALYLNAQNQIIEQKTIFIGSVLRSIAEPREILHYAIKQMATSIIIVHNHPSGKVKPSLNDDHFTEKLKEACQLLGIVLLDHLIIGVDKYFSYREETDLI